MHQLLAGVRGAFGILYYAHDLVYVVDADYEPFQNMLARLRLFQFELGAAQNDEALIVDVVPYYIQKPELLRLAACYGDHVYAERALKVGIL